VPVHRPVNSILIESSVYIERPPLGIETRGPNLAPIGLLLTATTDQDEPGAANAQHAERAHS